MLDWISYDCKDVVEEGRIKLCLSVRELSGMEFLKNDFRQVAGAGKDFLFWIPWRSASEYFLMAQCSHSV